MQDLLIFDACGLAGNGGTFWAAEREDKGLRCVGTIEG
jgi:hypothetical protein